MQSILFWSVCHLLVSFFIAVEYILQTFTGGFILSPRLVLIWYQKKKKISYIFRFIIFKTHQHYIINNTCFFVKLWNQKHTIIDLFSLKRICFILKINCWQVCRSPVSVKLAWLPKLTVEKNSKNNTSFFHNKHDMLRLNYPRLRQFKVGWQVTSRSAETA